MSGGDGEERERESFEGHRINKSEKGKNKNLILPELENLAPAPRCEFFFFS